MSKSKSPTSIRVDDIWYEKLKTIATRERRSVNAQIEMAIEQLVRSYEKEHGDIELADE